MNFTKIQHRTGSCQSPSSEDQKLVSSARNSQNLSANRLFSSSSDQFSHDSYNVASSGGRFAAVGCCSSPKQSKFKSLLQALPSANRVKQKLSKRWSADNRPASYSPPLGFDWLLEGLEHDVEFDGGQIAPLDPKQRVCPSANATDKRSRTRYREQCKLFRDFLSDWSLTDLHRLTIEFDASRAVFRLSRACDVARPAASRVGDDLGALLTNGFLTDAVLSVDGSADDPQRVHGSLLAIRSPFFRELLRTESRTGEHTSITLKTEQVNEMSGQSLPSYLRYIYTGSTVPNPDPVAGSGSGPFNGNGSGSVTDLIDETSSDFYRGENADDVDDLLTDLKRLYEITHAESDACDSILEPDIVLIFINSSLMHASLADSRFSMEQKHSIFKCHAAILAARSSFFRTLIEKRRFESSNFVNKPDIESCHYNDDYPGLRYFSAHPTEIMLDESVIPRQYAPVILNAMYTDEVDLSLIIRGCVSSSSCLTEVQAIASGKCQVSPVDEATEIYQIARFIEFAKLAQGCEDIIVQHISVETVPAIYNWSNESYGSKFVRRHCVNFACQEFVKISNSATLFDLEESFLVDVLKSDFLQASELEILSALLKWGEHQLVKRIEEREPNILSGTTHSISRKGVRRSDLSDDELREVLENLTPLIRLNFLLPAQHSLFQNAQARHLLTSAQSIVGGAETQDKASNISPSIKQRIEDKDKNDTISLSNLPSLHSRLNRLSACRRTTSTSDCQTPAEICSKRRTSVGPSKSGPFSSTNNWQAIANSAQSVGLSHIDHCAERNDSLQSPTNRQSNRLQAQAISRQAPAHTRLEHATRFPMTSSTCDANKSLLSKMNFLSFAEQSQALASVDCARLPRLFVPFYDTTRRELEQRLSARPDQLCALINAVAKPVRCATSSNLAASLQPLVGVDKQIAIDPQSDEFIDCPVPSEKAMQAMRRRFDKLLNSNLARKALACGCSYHREATLELIRLKIVRNFGLNDAAARFLRDQPAKSNRCPIDYRVSVDVFNADPPNEEDLSQSPIFGDGFSINFFKNGADKMNLFPIDSTNSAASIPKKDNACSSGPQVSSRQTDWPDLMTSSKTNNPIGCAINRDCCEIASSSWSTDALHILSDIKVNSFTSTLNSFSNVTGPSDETRSPRNDLNNQGLQSLECLILSDEPDVLV